MYRAKTSARSALRLAEVSRVDSTPGSGGVARGAFRRLIALTFSCAFIYSLLGSVQMFSSQLVATTERVQMKMSGGDGIQWRATRSQHRRRPRLLYVHRRNRRTGVWLEHGR